MPFSKFNKMNKIILLSLILVLSISVSIFAYLNYNESMDEKVISIVDNAIMLYSTHGEEAAFQKITNQELNDEFLYPFVIDLEGKIIAHGYFPERIGTDSIFIINEERSFESIKNDLDEYGHTWIEYTFTNPEDNKEEHKRSYLTIHDGYIFGSGYYTQ